MNAPPRPEEGVISWNINTACNYRCSYCTQRFKDDRTRWSRDTARFLAAFARLPGRWEVKISGGEPFVHPTLDEITAGLAALHFRISIVTNFSASEARLSRFIEAAAGRLGVFSASLHLEYVEDLDAFLQKALWAQGALQAAADPSCPAPSLCVTSVATRAAIPRLGELASRFREAGVLFKLQPEKQDSRVIRYTPEEEATLLSLGGHNLTGEIEHRYKGRPCWAGARYLILDDRGEAYRCYPARRKRRDYLGNFLTEGFQLFEEPAPCWYDTCHCTVPISRGMMSKTSEEEIDAVQDL